MCSDAATRAASGLGFDGLVVVDACAAKHDEGRTTRGGIARAMA